MSSWIRALAAGVVVGLLAGCGGSDSTSPPPDTTTPIVPVPIPPTVPVPAVPSILSVEPGDTVNTVQWSAVASAASYTLYWSETIPLTKTSGTAIPNAVSPYKHTGLTNGKLLYYAVAARSAGGDSELSSVMGAMPVAPVPAAPLSVSATSGDTVVTLAWSPVSGADSYNIHWSKAAGVVPNGNGVTKIDRLRTTTYLHTSLTLSLIHI